MPTQDELAALPRTTTTETVHYLVQTVSYVTGRWRTEICFRNGTALRTKNPKEADEVIADYRGDGIDARRVRETVTTVTVREVA